MSEYKKTQELRKTLKEGIDNSQAQALQEVENRLVSEEVKRRSVLIIEGISRLENLEKKLESIKPDNKTYGDSGEVLQEGFSEETNVQRNQCKASIKELSEALEVAIDGADYKKLNKLV